MRTIIVVFTLLFTAFASALGQDVSDRESKLVAMQGGWGIAEKTKDAKALDSILDNSLVYTDWDGTVMNKAEYMAYVQASTRHPEQEMGETSTALEYGDMALVTGIYRVKGVNQGKPYQRRGRFAYIWIIRGGSWTCVAAQFTVISKP